MDAIDTLVKEHCRLKEELARIAEDISSVAFGQRVHEFALKYQGHEAAEEDLFGSFLETMAESNAAWPLKGYQDVHGGARALFEELQNAIESSRPLSIQRAFSNFHLMALSHFEYEENWIFPLIRKDLQKRVKLSDDEDVISN